MDIFKLEKTNNEPSSQDKKTMVEGMLSYHASKGHIRKEKDEQFSVVIKNDTNKAVGVIWVSFRWGAMHIQTLWIDEGIRKQGWGKKLMEMAEEEAKKRNCYLAYTDTYSWQAPGFYEKLGYKLYGKLDDFPKGNSLSYFCKKLK